MIRPTRFGFNVQTAQTNTFQQQLGLTQEEIQQRALREFDCMIDTLRQNDVDVIVESDVQDSESPDSIFPNNWFSTHENGPLILYPLAHENRRTERRTDIIVRIQLLRHSRQIIDLRSMELRGEFLEGTGSLVLDRKSRFAYAALSGRSSQLPLQIVCDAIGYHAIRFDSIEIDGISIYHTNVIMSIGEKTAIVCFDAIRDDSDRGRVHQSLVAGGHEIVSITTDQMGHFAANALLIRNRKNQTLWVMSTRALSSLEPDQKRILEKDGRIVSINLQVIEQVGGGSARCMIAEIFA